MKSTYAASLIALMCMTAGCSIKLKDCQSLKVDDPKIIKFANSYANTYTDICGYADLTSFEQPEVTEYPDHWNVFYKGKAAADGTVFLGHFFTVTIDKKTCKGSRVCGM